MSDKISGIVNWQFDSVFILQKCKIFLNVVSEDHDIRVLATDGEEFLSIKIPYFIIVVLSGLN